MNINKFSGIVKSAGAINRRPNTCGLKIKSVQQARMNDSMLTTQKGGASQPSTSPASASRFLSSAKQFTANSQSTAEKVATQRTRPTPGKINSPFLTADKSCKIPRILLPMPATPPTKEMSPPSMTPQKKAPTKEMSPASMTPQKKAPIKEMSPASMTPQKKAPTKEMSPISMTPPKEMSPTSMTPPKEMSPTSMTPPKKALTTEMPPASTAPKATKTITPQPKDQGARPKTSIKGSVHHKKAKKSAAEKKSHPLHSQPLRGGKTITIRPTFNSETLVEKAEKTAEIENEKISLEYAKELARLAVISEPSQLKLKSCLRKKEPGPGTPQKKISFSDET